MTLYQEVSSIKDLQKVFLFKLNLVECTMELTFLNLVLAAAVLFALIYADIQ